MGPRNKWEKLPADQHMKTLGRSCSRLRKTPAGEEEDTREEIRHRMETEVVQTEPDEARNSTDNGKPNLREDTGKNSCCTEEKQLTSSKHKKSFIANDDIVENKGEENNPGELSRGVLVLEDGLALGRTTCTKTCFTCAMCGRAYTSKHYLECHLRTHTGERPYLCQVCDFSSVYREHMQRHMTCAHLIVESNEPDLPRRRGNRKKNKDSSTEEEREQGKERLLKKTDCNFSSGKKKNKVVPDGNRRRNIRRKRFKCIACGLKATHKTDLVDHIREEHPNAQIESLDNGDGSKTHLVVTVSKSNKRMVSHHRSFTCSHCPKVFQDSWKYKAHLRSHMGIKPFGCSVCSFFGASKMTIRDHIHRKHKGATNPKILLRSLNMNGTIDHMELNMPCTQFKCKHCDEVFEDNYHLRLHKKKSHLEAAPFSCTLCNHRGWDRYNLIVHCIQTHKAQELDGLILHNNRPISVDPQKLSKYLQGYKVFPDLFSQD